MPEQRRPIRSGSGLLWPILIAGGFALAGLALLVFFWMSPRWRLFFDASSGFWAVFVIAATAAAGVLIFMLMRYERRLVPRNVGNTLLTLRIILLLIWLVIMLEPVARWTFDRNESGRILVAVDLSESMTTTDEHAGNAEKLRWARALGMIGNEKTNARIDRWIDAYARDKEPKWVDDNETDDPQKRQQLSRARQETVKSVFKEIDRLSRKEIALRLLARGNAPLLQKLKEIGDVDVVVFGGKAEAVDDKTLETSVKAPPLSIQSGLSDLRTALTAKTGGDGDRVIGVVLLTDGRDTAGREILGAARSLGNNGAKVFPVILGSVLKPTDISIGKLDLPDHPQVEKKAEVKATINTSGFEGKELTVVLEQNGKDAKTKTIKPAGPETPITFELDTKTKGRKEYTIRVDVQKGEARDDNNDKQFAVNVTDDKVRVLLVEGEARWEFRFIESAFHRDEKGVELKNVVFRQPYLGILDSNFFPKKLVIPDKPGDLEKSSFAEPDLVVLGDVSPAELPEKAWKLLEQFVSESGGTLVIVAGKEYMPLQFNSPTLEAMLPVKNLKPLNITGQQAEAAPTERGFRLQLTEDAKREKMFQFENDPARNTTAWLRLPGHMWGLVGEAKPGTTVFAYANEPGKEQTLKEQRQSALIVQRHYGFGQVVWIGIDSTWRWRHRVGDKYHHHFWGGLGLWSAKHKAIAGNEKVGLNLPKTDVQKGEEVVIEVNWKKKTLQQYPKITAKALICRPDDKDCKNPVDTVELEHGSTPLRRTGRSSVLPPGRYKVHLKMKSADGKPVDDGTPVVADLVVHERLTKELEDLSSNRQLLDDLAQAGAGKLLLPDEAHRIPAMLRNPDADKEFGTEHTLWDNWRAMLLFFGLLAVEWVVRKLNGLP